MNLKYKFIGRVICGAAIIYLLWASFDLERSSLSKDVVSWLAYIVFCFLYFVGGWGISQELRGSLVLLSLPTAAALWGPALAYYQVSWKGGPFTYSEILGPHPDMTIYFSIVIFILTLIAYLRVFKLGRLRDSRYFPTPIRIVLTGLGILIGFLTFNLGANVIGFDAVLIVIAIFIALISIISKRFDLRLERAK